MSNETIITEDGIRWDIGTGQVDANMPNKTLPFCRGRIIDESAYWNDPHNNCQLTDAVYRTALSFAIARGDSIPNETDYQRALTKFPQF